MKHHLVVLVLIAIAVVLAISVFKSTDAHPKIPQQEKPIFTCIGCNGSGQRPEDVNKLLIDAMLALFINQHVSADMCEECFRLQEADKNAFCGIVDVEYQRLLLEYEPKVEMTLCSECLGMGKFTIQAADGHYLTQEEYEEREKEKSSL